MNQTVSSDYVQTSETGLTATICVGMEWAD